MPRKKGQSRCGIHIVRSDGVEYDCITQAAKAAGVGKITFTNAVNGIKAQYVDGNGLVYRRQQWQER